MLVTVWRQSERLLRHFWHYFALLLDSIAFNCPNANHSSRPSHKFKLKMEISGVRYRFGCGSLLVTWLCERARGANLSSTLSSTTLDFELTGNFLFRYKSIDAATLCHARTQSTILCRRLLCGAARSIHRQINRARARTNHQILNRTIAMRTFMLNNGPDDLFMHSRCGENFLYLHLLCTRCSGVFGLPHSVSRLRGYRSMEHKFTLIYRIP